MKTTKSTKDCSEISDNILIDHMLDLWKSEHLKLCKFFSVSAIFSWKFCVYYEFPVLFWFGVSFQELCVISEEFSRFGGDFMMFYI